MDRARPRRVLEGVVEQVADDLLDPGRVGLNEGRFQVEQDPVFGFDPREPINHLCGNPRQVDIGEVEFGRAAFQAGHVEQLHEQRGHAAHRTLDSFQTALDAALVEVAALAVQEERVDRQLKARDGRLELMRGNRQESVPRAERLLGCQPRLALDVQLPLALGGGSGIGHVAGDLREAVEPTVVVEGVDRSISPEAGPVLAKPPPLVIGASLAFGLAQDAFRPPSFDVLRRIEHRDVLTDHFVRLVSLDALGALVPGQDIAVGTDEEDRVVEDRVDQEADRLRPVRQIGEGTLGRCRSSIRRLGLGDSHKQPPGL